MIRLSIWGCPLASLLLAASAHAQDAEYFGVPARYPAHVSISAGKGSTSLQIVPQGESQPVAECESYCDFWALPGRYTLYTRDHASGERRELGFRVKHSIRYSLREGDDTARDAGLAVGISGSVAVLAGILMTMPVVFAAMCEDSNCVSDSERSTANIGLGLMAAGAIATPIGFSVFSHNRTLLRPVTDDYYAASEPGVSVRVGVVGVNAGLGLGGLAVF